MRLRNSKYVSDCLLGESSRSVKISNFGNIFIGKLGVAVAFSVCMMASPLDFAISHVVRLGSVEKMVGINASTIIAPVANAWIYQRTKMQNITSYVGLDRFLTNLSTPGNVTITTLITGRNASLPYPTTVGLFYELPKAFWKIGRKTLRGEELRSNLDRHSISSVVTVLASDQRQLAGAFLFNIPTLKGSQPLI